MAYFDKAEVGDKVYGFVFGKGKIVDVFPDSFYTLLVEFKNGYEVPYTEDGVPGWGNFKKQTLFYRNDIDLSKKDFSPVLKTLSIKKIIKLREKGQLEIRVPSGIWKSIKKVDEEYIEQMLEEEQLHLFREAVTKKKKSDKKDTNKKEDKKNKKASKSEKDNKKKESKSKKEKK